MARLTGARFVAANKVRQYLMNMSHVDGASKAQFFFGFGFAASAPDELIAALSAHPDDNELIASERTAFGVKSIVQCRIKTPDGRDPCIRTVWMRDPDATIHRLVTAYPAVG